MGGGGGGWLSSKGVSNQLGPFLNFPPPFFFSANWVACEQTITKLWLVNQSLISSARRLRIELTVEINLTAKKLLKIAIRTTWRMTGLAVCKSRIYNFILSAKKYEKKGQINKDAWLKQLSSNASLLCWVIWVMLNWCLCSTNLFYVVSGLLPCWSLWSSLSLVWSKCRGKL